ncbi:Gfo/Idh/MocA family protein [Martelella radicis]|uniref:1,5-anhydro-D-fructose reductase (1,5-anhydro-D-mannitol-forming) n=1 Tax=Martelella radicis TaxID=1397476 RepID=A0A7W6KHE8_9HYPH|nr:Gfo/Idh/MocA family oxidoreductase [Martelella radicis]MBB4121157.1 1,5-anhydro-D-fructose reductase (1,5-anhydro-D-mannitol-forming) [Martelella radicis]
MKWGLVGASTIASEHMIGAIRAQAGHTVEAVLSSSAERGQAFATRNGIPHAFTDLETLLARPEIGAVYISTTNEKHFSQAMAAFAAGKHVLCEKPLALSVDDAAQMVEAARNAGLVFATNHHLRCAGAHLAIRQIIAEGRLGHVLSVRVFHAVSLPEHLRGWRIDNRDAGGGVIADITVHDADTVRFHLGEDPKTVVAQAVSSGLGEGVEDSVMSVWTMPSGIMVQSHESFTHPYAGSGIEVHGTEGSLFAQGVMTQRPTGTITMTDKDGTVQLNYDRHDLYGYGLKAFNRAVAGHGRPAADGVDGLKSLAVAMAVARSAREGRAVDVDYKGY